MPTDPHYFDSPAALGRWFAENGASATELVVGFMKSRTGAAGLSWPQAIDEALCVGWIDGVRHRVDDARYRIRFTPRKPGSHWSAVNIARVAELEASGRMSAAGRAAVARRTEARSRMASYERAGTPELDAAELEAFGQLPGARAFYEALPRGERSRLAPPRAPAHRTTPPHPT